MKDNIGKVRVTMDEIMFLRAKSAFAGNGGEIVQSAEGDKLLDYRGADAVTLNEKLIIFRSGSPPTLSEFYEEFIHTAQFRNGSISTATILAAEVEAKEKLIKFQKQYGISDNENAQTIAQLNQLKEGE